MIKYEKPVMYLGPTIRGVVKYGAVFSNGIPKKLEKIVQKKPIMESLIAPLEEIVDRKKKIDEEGSVEFVAYDAIEALKQEEINEILKEGE